MPQLSLYLTDEAMNKLRADAAHEGKTLSRYANDLIAHSEPTGWPAGYFDLYGSIPDFEEPEDYPLPPAVEL